MIEKEAVGSFESTVGLLRKVVEPAAKIISHLGVAVMGLLVLMLLYGVVARKVFNAPLKGDIELSQIGMILITFFFVSATYFRADQMVMDSLTQKFPPKMKAINDSVIYFLDCLILALLAWQLFVQAIELQSMHQTSTVLAIPVYYFVFVGAVCTSLLTLVFVLHFLNELNRARRK